MAQEFNTPQIAAGSSMAGKCSYDSGTQTFWMSRDELMAYLDSKRERHRGARTTDWSKSMFGIDKDPE